MSPLRLAATAVVLFSVVSLANTVSACTAETYPLATLVTDSPLILLGRIEAVEERAPSWGDVPMVASVRVLQVIHGPPMEGLLRIASGPLAS